jgi:hypothetical protein
MATLAELCKEYGVDLDGLDKQAQDAGNKDEVSTEEEDAKKILEQLKKESENGGKEKMNLTELYNEMAGEEQEEKTASYLSEQDLDKIAEVEVEKMAAYTEEERTKGRFLAMGFISELEKNADIPEEEMTQEILDAQVPNDYTEGVADMTGLDVQTENDVEDVLVEQEIEDLIGKPEGINVSGITGQDNLMASEEVVKEAEANVHALLKTADFYYNEGVQLAKHELTEISKYAQEEGEEPTEEEVVALEEAADAAEEAVTEEEAAKEEMKEAVKEEMKKNAAYRRQILSQYR